MKTFLFFFAVGALFDLFFCFFSFTLIWIYVFPRLSFEWVLYEEQVKKKGAFVRRKPRSKSILVLFLCSFLPVCEEASLLPRVLAYPCVE